jgi:RNA polymerase sigma factor (TIGR02999 family)
MRQILVNYARRKRSAKRGGRHEHVPFHEIEATLERPGDPAETGADALLALDESLSRLMSLDPRQGRIVECRFFSRMTIRATADALGVSPATVKRGWATARAWLYRDLKESVEQAE